MVALSLLLAVVSAGAAQGVVGGLATSASGTVTATVESGSGTLECEDPDTHVAVAGEGGTGTLAVAYAGACRLGYTAFDLEADCPGSTLAGDVRCTGTAQAINAEATYALSLVLRGSGGFRLSVVTVEDGTNVTLAGELVRV